MGKKKLVDLEVKAHVVLEDLCRTIESTGGIVPNPECDGTYVPEADHDWVDMADVYLKACTVLGRKPKIEE